MTTETITLNVIIKPTPPPEHTKYDCLCSTCWEEFVAWCDRTEELTRP